MAESDQVLRENLEKYTRKRDACGAKKQTRHSDMHGAGGDGAEEREAGEEDLGNSNKTVSR